MHDNYSDLRKRLTVKGSVPPETVDRILEAVHSEEQAAGKTFTTVIINPDKHGGSCALDGSLTIGINTESVHSITAHEMGHYIYSDVQLKDNAQIFAQTIDELERTEADSGPSYVPSLPLTSESTFRMRVNGYREIKMSPFEEMERVSTFLSNAIKSEKKFRALEGMEDIHAHLDKAATLLHHAGAIMKTVPRSLQDVLDYFSTHTPSDDFSKLEAMYKNFYDALPGHTHQEKQKNFLQTIQDIKKTFHEGYYELHKFQELRADRYAISRGHANESIKAIHADEQHDSSEYRIGVMGINYPSWKERINLAKKFQPDLPPK